MASPELAPALDESALTQDIVKLLGAELQRLKRELFDARAQVERHESGGSTSRPETDETVKSLLEENEQLKKKLAGRRERYVEAKEANKDLQAQLQEFKEREKNRPLQNMGALDESEMNHLQKQTIMLENHLRESDNYAKDLLLQLEAFKKEKTEMQSNLDTMSHKLWKSECNNPWTYLQNANSSHAHPDSLQIRPFSDCSSIRNYLSTLPSNITDKLGHNMSKLLVRSQPIHLIWSRNAPQHCISLDPTFVYKPNDLDGRDWTREPSPDERNGEVRELLYQLNNNWYYCGSYSTTVIRTSDNNHFFNSLEGRDQLSLLNRTILRQELVPPIVQDLIRALYEKGLLRIACTVYERIGYDEELQAALQALGERCNGPILDLTKWVPRKRKADETEPAHRGPGKTSKKIKSPKKKTEKKHTGKKSNKKKGRK